MDCQEFESAQIPAAASVTEVLALAGEALDNDFGTIRDAYSDMDKSENDPTDTPVGPPYFCSGCDETLEPSTLAFSENDGFMMDPYADWVPPSLCRGCTILQSMLPPSLAPTPDALEDPCASDKDFGAADKAFSDLDNLGTSADTIQHISATNIDSTSSEEEVENFGAAENAYSDMDPDGPSSSHLSELDGSYQESDKFGGASNAYSDLDTDQDEDNFGSAANGSDQELDEFGGASNAYSDLDEESQDADDEEDDLDQQVAQSIEPADAPTMGPFTAASFGPVPEEDLQPSNSDESEFLQSSSD